MPNTVELTAAELEILSHALELFIQRYSKTRDHWAFFARKHLHQGVEASHQGAYEGLFDAHRMFTDAADKLIRKVDTALKQSPASEPTPIPRSGTVHEDPTAILRIDEDTLRMRIKKLEKP